MIKTKYIIWSSIHNGNASMQAFTHKNAATFLDFEGLGISSETNCYNMKFIDGKLRGILIKNTDKQINDIIPIIRVGLISLVFG